jgi:hypothetical protein
MTDDKIGRATVERAFQQLPDEANFELTMGDAFAVFLFAPLCGDYVYY